MSTPIRLAVITDVHGNSLALEAVLQDIRRAAPDQVINLGDQVWGQVDPKGAYELQSQLAAIEVRGNNDEKPLLAADRLAAPDAAYRDWLLQHVSAEELKRLNSLPLTALAAEGRVLAAHGTPTSAWDNLLWRLADDRLVPREEDEFAADLEQLDESVEVVVVGHTHRERIVRSGGRLLVNAGPVAWQQDGDPRARWTLLERRGTDWHVEARRVAYDWFSAAKQVAANRPVQPEEAAAHLVGVDQRP